MKNRNELINFINKKILSINGNIQERCSGQFLSKEQMDNIKTSNPFTITEDFIAHEIDIAKLNELKSIKQFLVSDGMFFLLEGEKKEQLAIFFTDDLTEITNLSFKFDQFIIKKITQLNDLDVHKYLVKGINKTLNDIEYIENNSFFSVEKFYQ